MNPFFDFFKKLSQGFFLSIQRMIGEQHATRYFRENLEVMQQAAKTAAETMDLADQLAAGNNPDKQRLAALIKDYANEGMKQVLTGQLFQLTSTHLHGDLADQPRRADLVFDAMATLLHQFRKLFGGHEGQTGRAEHDQVEQPVAG